MLAFTSSLALSKPFVHGSVLKCSPSMQPAAAAGNRQQPQMAFTSIGGVLTDAPTTAYDSNEMVISKVLNQVFGNAHLMDSELEELAEIQSDYVMTKDVREFIRALGKSEGYKDRFFESVSMYRCVELAFKHLMGRAPENKEEYAQVMNMYHTKGYDAMIDLLVDSVEYDENFGGTIVPYPMYMGCWPSNQLFNYSVALRYQPSCSDKSRSSLLQYAICSGDSPNWLSISKGLPAGNEKGTGFQFTSYTASTSVNKNAPVRVGTKVPGGVVFY